MSNNPTINAKGVSIRILTKENNDDYISLTDIAKYKNNDSPGYVIQNWLRNRDTIEFLGLWEQLNNPNFNCLEFEAIKNESGRNAFVMTPKKWVSTVNAIGILTRQGRYAATYAHKDIAMEFASWISAEFKLYLIKDYQRLKEEEAKQLSSEWDIKRILSKINYKIHTDAIKNNLIPDNITSKEKGYTYANEADILNVALFGKTAKQWRCCGQAFL